MSVNTGDIRWQDLALCAAFPPSIFFEEYESDERTARVTDQICASCPVREQCLISGIEGGEWGVWGMVFLVNGRIEPTKNEHKSPEDWKIAREFLPNE